MDYTPGDRPPGVRPIEAAPGGTAHAPRRRGRAWLVILPALLAAGGAAWWWHGRGTKEAAGDRSQRSGPQPVGVATAGRGDVRVVLSGLGTVTPLAMVTVRTQIAGQLQQLGFREGQTVRAGDFLAQIDPRPYQVALEQAQGALARDQATLRNAQADLKRYQTLLAQDSISRQQVDTQAAAVRQAEGTLLTDQAGIDAARLNLTYCRITAPIGGRVGLRQVDAGNYVQTGDANGLVVLTQLQPISVLFALPEDDLPQVIRRMREASLPVEAHDRANAHLLATGRLETTDNQIDTSTGTVKLRAVFDNADTALFPNQFVNAKLLVDTHHGVVTIPPAAVQRGAPGSFVYLIRPDETVTVRPVTLGPQDGDAVEVSKGLEAGDRVVTDGADRLREDAKVTIPAEGDKQGERHDRPAGDAAPRHGRRGNR